MGVPKGREAGLQYAKEFIEELKATGFVAGHSRSRACAGCWWRPPRSPRASPIHSGQRNPPYSITGRSWDR